MWTAASRWQVLAFSGTSLWEAPLPSGTDDRWVGKGFAANQQTEWTRFAATHFDGTTRLYVHVTSCRARTSVEGAASMTIRFGVLDETFACNEIASDDVGNRC